MNYEAGMDGEDTLQFQLLLGKELQKYSYFSFSYHRKNLGTPDQCWSLHFQKYVRYLSETCQKSVTCKKAVRNVPEICQIFVGNLSYLEMWQNSVRPDLDKCKKSV